MSVTGNDRPWRELLARLKTRDAHVKVGILQARGGDADAGDGMTMVGLGTIHEFGAPAAGIPERSFIRRTFADPAPTKAVAARLVTQVVEGGMSLRTALDALGAWGAAAVKKTITAGPHIPPALKPATVARKGSDRPLVDTGRLVGSISWEVSERDGTA